MGTRSAVPASVPDLKRLVYENGKRVARSPSPGRPPTGQMVVEWSSKLAMDLILRRALGPDQRIRRLAARMIAQAMIAVLTTTASATVPIEPVVPARLVDLLEYHFDGDEVDDHLLRVTNVLDRMGWLDGEINGDPTEVAGVTGDALEFDGVDDYIQVLESRNVSFRHGVFVRANVILSSDTWAFSRGIVTKWYPDQWLLDFNRVVATHGRLAFTVRLDDGTPAGEYHTIEYLFPSAAYLDAWIQVTAIYDPQVGMQLFVDGSLVAFDPQVVDLPIIDAFQPIRIGDSGNDWSNFEGVIDDVVVYGDFSPAPNDTQPLVHYDFDDGQVAFSQTDNLVAGAGINWMKGALFGDWALADGPTSVPGDRAIALNPIIPPEPEDELEHVDVIRGHLLTFTRGIAVVARIYLPEELSQDQSYRIAGQLAPAGEGDDSTPWRLYIAHIDAFEKFNLIFEMNFEDGRHILLKYPLDGQDDSPPGYQDRWIDVGASYDPPSGVAALYWDHRREVVPNEPVRQGAIRTGADVRIGLAGVASSVTAFGGLIDEVRIWGDRSCVTLTTEAEPADAGTVVVAPAASRMAFCGGSFRYTTGEIVGLEAIAEPQRWFYRWSGNLDYLEGSSNGMYDVEIAMTDNTNAKAEFKDRVDAPVMERFPVAGCHNTSVDFPGARIDELACGRRARALANSACHVAGQDIFAELGTTVVAAQTGYVRFRCDRDVQTNDPYGGNVAEIVTEIGTDGTWTAHRFMYYYAHLDTVCAKVVGGDAQNHDAENPCGTDWTPELGWACTGFVPVERRGPWWYGIDSVTPGTVLGLLGRSGNAAGTSHHLHFSIGDNIGEPDVKMWSCAALDPFPILYALEDGSCPDSSSGNDFETGDLGGWTSGGR
jgi:hypothetical protein